PHRIHHITRPPVIGNDRRHQRHSRTPPAPRRKPPHLGPRQRLIPIQNLTLITQLPPTRSRQPTTHHPLKLTTTLQQPLKRTLQRHRISPRRQPPTTP